MNRTAHNMKDCFCSSELHSVFAESQANGSTTAKHVKPADYSGV